MKKDRRKTNKRTLDGMIMLFFMVLFLGVFSVCAVRQAHEYKQLKQEEMKILVAIQAEKEKNIEYQNNKKYYTSDAYIEKVAREQLGLVKPNEVLYINRGK